MNQLVITDLDGSLIQRLGERAASHGRTVEVEAKSILAEAVGARADSANSWAAIDRIRNELAASGRDFVDSVDLLAEDRQR